MPHDASGALEERPTTQNFLSEILRMDEALLRREVGWARVREAMQAASPKFKEGWRRREAPLETQRAALRIVEARLRRTGAEHEAAFMAEWRGALLEMDRMRREIREKQPLLSNLTAERLTDSPAEPEFLALGRLRFALAGSDVMIAPRLTVFPPDSALRLEKEGDEGRREVRLLLLRLLTAATPQRLRLVICDPSGGGEAVEPFLPLLQAPRPFVDHRVLARAEEIERALEREVALLEEARRSRLKSAGSGAWEDSPFTLIVVFDHPEGLSEAASASLAELIRHGPKLRTTPLLIGCGTPPTGVADELWRACVKPFCDPPREAARLKRLTCVEEQELWPEAAAFLELLPALSRRFQKVGRPDLRPERILPPEDFWTEDARQSFSALIGRDDQGGGIWVDLRARGHILTTGAVAEDKTGLTPLLIRSFLHRHSPQSLRLMLLDFSADPQLPLWADPPPPHAELLALGVQPEQGVEILRGLLELLRRRARLLQEGAEPEARLLVVLQEFPALFSGETLQDMEAERLLAALALEGPACGAHFIFATLQEEEKTPAFLRRKGGVLRLRRDQAAEGGGSSGAASSERFRAVLESASGAISFEGPRLSHQALRSGAEAFRTAARRQGALGSPRFFRGDVPPPPPAPHEFRARIGFPQIGGPADPPRLWLGERPPLHQEDFLFDLEPRAGSNLLIVGEETKTRARLLQALLWSLACCDSLEDLLYLGPTESLAAKLAAHAPRSLPFRGLRRISAETPMAPPAGGRCKILLWDAPPVEGAADAPRFRRILNALLGRSLQEASSVGVHTIAFVSPALLSQDPDLGKACALRIGFGLTREHMAQICGASSARRIREGEAVFADLRKGRRVLLRPFRSLIDAQEIQARAVQSMGAGPVSSGTPRLGRKGPGGASP